MRVEQCGAAVEVALEPGRHRSGPGGARRGLGSRVAVQPGKLRIELIDLVGQLLDLHGFGIRLFDGVIGACFGLVEIIAFAPVIEDKDPNRNQHEEDK